MPAFTPFACELLIAALALTRVNAWSDDLRDIVSATHWNPCYYNTTLPSLLDGLATLKDMGTRSIKLALDNPLGNYPWHSSWPATPFPSVVALARHPYYVSAFSDPVYTSYSLITYSQGESIKIPCDGDAYDDAAAAVDTAQLRDLTAHLLTSYPSKTFILDSWENDWWARCGSYDPSTPIQPAVVAAYTRWLAARQTGVTAARIAACLAGSWNATSCAADDGAAAAAAQGGAVWHAAEVNLVLTSLTEGRPNLITMSVPHVSLDMITYSSYDCMDNTRLFGSCLDFIRDHHNRTKGAPSPAIAIAEFGVPEMQSPERILPVITNVLGKDSAMQPRSDVLYRQHCAVVTCAAAAYCGSCPRSSPAQSQIVCMCVETLRPRPRALLHTPPLVSCCQQHNHFMQPLHYLTALTHPEYGVLLSFFTVRFACV